MIDLSNDRKSVEIQILGFIRKGQIVPYRVLQHYNHILNAQAASSSSTGSGPSSGGGSSTAGSTDSTTITTGINDSEANDYLRDLNNEVTDFNNFVQTNQQKKANAILNFSGTVNSTITEIVPADTNAVDLILQNVGTSPFLLAVKEETPQTQFKGLIIPPQGVITFSGYSAQQAFEAVKNTEDTSFASFFAYRTTIISEAI